MQQHSRRMFGAMATATVVGLVFAATAATTVWAADKFPSGTIQVVIHSAYGGGTDVTARMMMIRSRRELKTDMQVVAKRGGSGSAAHKYALERAKDGHTLLALTQTHLYTIAQGKSPLKINDLIGVARAMDDPTFVVVSGKSNIKSLADLVAASKKKPVAFGVAQIGGTEHIGLATFAKASGLKYKVVPFGSGGKMVQALMSGAIDGTLPNVSEAGEQVKDGTFRALAVMAEKRLGGYPNIPTTYEQGFKVKTSTTRGYAVLKGTPQPVIDKLSKALVKAMHHKVFADYLKSAGLSVDESVAGSAVWTKQLHEEYALAAEALKDLGLLKKKKK